MTLSERARAALDLAFDEEIKRRFAAFNEWIAGGQSEIEMGGEPKTRFERSLRQLKTAYADAATIIAKVFA